MSLFFRPVVGNPKMKEMWGRCDLCFISGPWPEFSVGEHERLTAMTVCQLCMLDDLTIKGLEACGWVIQ